MRPGCGAGSTCDAADNDKTLSWRGFHDSQLESSVYGLALAKDTCQRDWAERLPGVRAWLPGVSQIPLRRRKQGLNGAL